MKVLESRHILHWSRDTPAEPAAMIAAALAIAAPVAYGVSSGHLGHASFAALGALATTIAPAPGLRETAIQATRAGLVAIVAGTVGAWVGGQGWTTAAAIVGLALVAAVVGGFSRWAADGTTRFITFAVIATGLGGADPLEVARWFGVGASLAVVLTVGASLFSRGHPGTAGPPIARLWRRWTRNLRGIDGWRYALRLVPCLALAEGVGAVWHQQKAYWIAVTVVIVIRRSGGSLLLAIQRCLGTCLGVLFGAALIVWVPPSWAIVAVVAVLAGLRPLLKARNYAAYATVMTPLLILLLDLGRTPALSTVGYRLIDTVIGCLIALIPGIARRTHVG